MHELSVTESILRIAVDEAKKYNALKVLRINIKMGELSELLPECIDYYFKIVSKNTAAEHAVLNVEKIPFKINCRNCGTVSEINIRKFRCPICSSQDLKIIGGNEFYIDSLEVE